ncbi:condensation domain-containing protein [Acrocarpospora catenulata]|uniref:condensation domain-containing protein n=1 Tax=Acrocarpospora catenulata TaxID=2836182 RepID=UPI001BDA099E|nr:condensation domain-containing protein [Acrocarpospora catenulata]
MTMSEQASEDRRRALVARLLAQKAAPQGVTPVPRDGSPLPCSHEQRRIWLAQQSDPTAAPNVTLGVRLSGPLDLGRLAAAFTALTARHEAFRTTFTLIDGDPHQVIRPGLPSPLEYLDLSALPEPEREPTALAMALAAGSERFPPATGPLLRLNVYRITPDDHRLFLVCHHIAADGGSLALVADDLAALYSGRERPPLPIQYADYAAWSVPRSAARLAERLPYWTERLHGSPPPLFGGKSTGDPASGRAGATALVRVDRELVDRLRRLGDGATTPFVTLCAAYFVLLQRMTGQRDQTVGIVSASRTRRELEPVVGTFVNMLPLRVALPAGQSFPSLITKVREAAAGALAHEIPFDTLVSQAGIARIPGVHPVFQTSFVHREDPRPPADWDGLAASVWDHEVDDATLDLAMTATPRGGEYELAFTGRLARFSPAEVRELPATFAALLTELSASR